MKNITITIEEASSSVDVNNSTTQSESKRLTIDISEDLHTSLKAKVATSKTSMADVVRKAIKLYCDQDETNSLLAHLKRINP